MKKRWTIKELAAVNDAQCTMEILRERRSELSNLYSPLAQRLASVINTLEEMAAAGGLTEEERSKNNDH